MAGFNGNNNIDIDQLTHMLEENRDLINDITSKESCKEGAAQIPKLLLDIITHKSDDAVTIDSAEPSTSTTGTEASASSKVTSPQEIVHNLPKVWRVLVELLNHQKLKPVQIQVKPMFHSINFPHSIHCQFSNNILFSAFTGRQSK